MIINTVIVTVTTNIVTYRIVSCLTMSIIILSRFINLWGQLFMVNKEDFHKGSN